MTSSANFNEICILDRTSRAMISKSTKPYFRKKYPFYVFVYLNVKLECSGSSAGDHRPGGAADLTDPGECWAESSELLLVQAAGRRVWRQRGSTAARPGRGQAAAGGGWPRNAPEQPETGTWLLVPCCMSWLDTMYTVAVRRSHPRSHPRSHHGHERHIYFLIVMFCLNCSSSRVEGF